MTRHLPSALLAAAVLTAAGCGGGYQPQPLAPVKFSLVYHYADAHDLDSPLAVGASTYVTDVAQDGTFQGLALHEPGSVFDPKAACWAWLGPCGLRPTAPRPYQLVAVSEQGSVVDGIPVTAKPIAGLRLSDHYEVYTHGASCDSHLSPSQGLSSFVLHPNQYLVVYPVLVDANDEALLGSKRFYITTADGIRTEWGPDDGSRMGNAVWIHPAGQLGDAQRITIEVQHPVLSRTFTLATSPDPAPVDCHGS